MKVFEKIDVNKHIQAWADRFSEEKSYYGGKEVAFSPAVQAQVSPNGMSSLGEMPAFSMLHDTMVAYEYTGWMDEMDSITKTCYIGDWSWLNKISLKGTNVWKCLEASTINNYNNFPIGKGKHIISITSEGKMIGDGIAFRMGENEVLLTAGLTLSAGQMLKIEGFDVEYKDVTSLEYCFHVQGPLSGKILEKATGQDISHIGFGQFCEFEIEGRKVRIYRGGMSGELGYELQGPSEDGSVIWKAIVDNGKDDGIRQYGYRAMMLNHLQAFFPTIWIDYIPAIFPKEAGLEALYRSPIDFGWGNRIDKNRDFPGKDILLAEMESPSHKSVTLEWNSEDVISIYTSLFDTENQPFEQISLPVNTSEIAKGEPMALPVFNSAGKHIGFATNRGYSLQFRKMLSLSYIDIDESEIGNEVLVLYGRENSRQIKIRATVQAVPYKKDVRR